MEDFLSHPLFLLLVGALLSGLLIPMFTRQWQDRQKELEIKTGLVSDLSKSIMEIVMSVQFVHLRKRRDPSRGPVDERRQQEFDAAYREWEVSSAIIGTKLQAYLSKTEIPEEWTDFSETLTEFYALEGIDDQGVITYALGLRQRLNDVLGPISSDENQGWGVTMNETQWQELRQGILKKQADLIEKILKASISAFGSSWLDEDYRSR